MQCKLIFCKESTLGYFISFVVEYMYMHVTIEVDCLLGKRPTAAAG